MSDGDLRHGGEDQVESFYVYLEWGLGTLFGLFSLAGTVGLIALDLSLGPNFLFSLATVLHLHLNSMAKWVPWAISLATSGTLYALWNLPSVAKGKGKNAFFLNLAKAIAIVDTLLDVAGFNAFITNDPNAGARVFLPLNAPLTHWFFDIVVAAACYYHERYLKMTLKRRWAVVSSKQNTAGARAESFFIYLSGWVLTVSTILAIFLGAVSMLMLNFILIPIVGGTPRDQWALAGISFGIVTGSVLFWQYADHMNIEVSFKSLRRVSAGGIVNNAKKASRDQRMLAGMFVLMIADSVLDLCGFNKVLFGSAGIIPANPSLAWGLTAFLVLAVCTADTALINAIFRPLALLKGVSAGNHGDIITTTTTTTYVDDPLGDPFGPGDVAGAADGGVDPFNM